ncbi:MerR family transcriptional regulator [Flexivirga sp. B27]
MADTSKLMSIGEFSGATRISVRMLRYYDANDVLTPADVDPVTGYRRYDARQLAIASRIRRLRDSGFGVSAIGALLDSVGTPAFDRALQMQRRTLVDDVAAARDRLRALDRMLAESSNAKESAMSDITVELVDLPATTVVSLRGTVASYAAEGTLWADFMPAIGAQQPPIIGPGGCIEHDGEFREADVTESVFLPVPPGTTAAEPLTVLDLPARRAVVARAVGPYGEAITAAHEAIARFVADNDLHVAYAADDVATHGFNIYDTDPSSTKPEDSVTRVHVPVS